MNSIVTEEQKKITPENHKVTRKWRAKYGYYLYSCGCTQYQDGWDYCSFHKPSGYKVVLANLVETDK